MDDYATLLDSLLAQERDLQFTGFDNDTALTLGLRFVEVARAESLAITIDICRNGQQLFHYAMPGTSPDNDDWIVRKNRVVARFGHSSYYQGVLYKSLNTTMEARSLLDPHVYAPFGGAFPLIIAGVGVVGTITVSGLPQKEDHALVVRVLAEFLGHTVRQSHLENPIER